MLSRVIKHLFVIGTLFFQINFLLGQQLKIEENTFSFKKSTVGTYGLLESTSLDSGGVLTFFVCNLDSNNSDTVKTVRFFYSGTEYFSEAYRVWPTVIDAAGTGNNFCAVTVKGMTFPFREGDSLDVVVVSANGDSMSSHVKCTTSKLVIANVLQGTDSKELKIYLRNEDTVACFIDSVLLNENNYDTLNALRFSSVSGNFLISPGEVGIYTLVTNDSMKNCYPLALRIHAVNASTTEGLWISSATRVVEPEFSIGTWSGSGMDPISEYGRKRLRQFPINSMHGPGNTGLMNIGEYEYFIKTVWEPSFGTGTSPDTSLAGPVVRLNALENFIHYWSVDDEPDLSGKPIGDEVLRNQTYWLNDKNTPSYVNLATEKKFNRYGWFTDVVAMDHYAAPTAPNIIPGTWIPIIGRAGELKEAFEYSEQLKLNTEPRLMESWCQLAADGTWSVQPEPFAVNYQFWSHVMAGSKGIHWFVAQAQTKDDFPNLWNEAYDIMRHFNGVKSLFYYSEPKSIDVLSGKVNGKILIGEKTVAIVLVNDSTNYYWNGPTFSWASQTDSTDFIVEFDLPEWVNPVQFFRLTANGKVPGSGLVHLGTNRYRLSSTQKLFKQALVFVIGETDTLAPKAPTRVNIPEYFDLANYTISWKEPFDNFGVDGYILKWNGVFVDTVRYPIYEVVNGDFNCSTGNWSIQAYDLEGNISAPGFLPITISIPMPIILVQPQDAVVVELQDTSFTVSAFGDGLHYQWQEKSPGGSWVNVTDTIQYSGIFSQTLIVNDVPVSLLNFEYRCLVTNNCGDTVITDPVTLDVVNGVDDLNDHFVFSVSPNPSTGRFVVSVRSNDQLTDYYLIDLYGRETRVDVSEQSKNTVTFDLSSFAQGLYFFKARNLKGNYYALPISFVK